MSNLLIYRLILICFSFATCVMLIKYEILPLFICFTFFFFEFLLTFKKQFMKNILFSTLAIITILNADLKQDLEKSGYPAHYTKYSVFELIDQKNQ